MHVPGAPSNVQSVAMAGQDGKYEDIEQHWPLKYGDQEEAFADVYVMARDAESGDVDIKAVKASLWIIEG
jgi:hypothetical protein